jgi:hypothetical protein
MLISKVTEADARMKDMAGNLGFSTQALSEFAFAAELSGVHTDELFVAMKKMEQGIGSGKSAGALKDIGLSIKDLINLAPEQQFEKIIGALAGVENQSIKASAAQDLFGKSGIKMIEITKDGVAGFNAMRSESRLLGGSLSEESAKAADDFDDALTRIKTAVMGVGRDMATARNESFADFINALAFKIPAAAFAAQRAFQEFGMEIGIFAGAFQQTFEELSKFETLLLTTPMGIASFVEKAFGRFRKDASVELDKFDKETQDQLDKIQAGWLTSPTPPSQGPLIDPDAIKASEDAAKAGEKLRNEIDGIVSSLEKEAATLGMTSEQVQFYTLMSKDATDADKERAAHAITLIQNYNDQQKAIQAITEFEKERQAALDEQIKQEDELARVKEIAYVQDLQNMANVTFAMDKNIDSTDNLKDAAHDMGLTFTSAFEDAVVGGKKFTDVLSGIFDDIQKMILRLTVTKPLEGLVGSLFDSIVGSLFGGGGAAWTTTGSSFDLGSWLPGMAHGGSVAPNQAYLVGEHGPELFTPGMSGSITPNDTLSGMGGDTLTIVQNIDARGSDISEARMRQILAENNRVVIRQIGDRQRRNRALN